MSFLQELKIFVKNILHWLYYFVSFSFFFFLFGPKEIVFWGRNWYVPLFSQNSLTLIFGQGANLSLLAPYSFAVGVFNIVRQDLLPANVQLIATNPMSAFLAQVSLSILLGFLITIPYLIFKIIIYLHPALLPREKKAVFWSLLPLILLFFAGCAFAYFFLIPETFKIFYPFATGMGVVPFFAIDKFVQYVFVLLVGVGLVFMIPFFVIFLSFIGIVKADFWISKWRFALMFFLILSAIIAPDVITMFMLFVPLMALYLAGCFFAKKFNSRD